MATDTDIKTVLSTLAGARLRNSPPREDIPQVIRTWGRVFAGASGADLQQAADDFILTGEFWPTPAEFRKAVNKVENNHGRSAYSDPSHDRVGKVEYLDGEEVETFSPAIIGCTPGIYRVTSGGWMPYRKGELKDKTECTE